VSIAAREALDRTREETFRPTSPAAEPSYESIPASARFINRLVLNPLRNYLLPAGLARGVLAKSRSPLIAEALVRPGSWRSMEITYQNPEPVDWIDNLALRKTPMALASRNRRKYVTRKLADLIGFYAARDRVTIVGVGAGPGLHVQNALAVSGVHPDRVSAYLIDRDGDAFDYGGRMASRLGLGSSLRFIQGDARQISALLPHVVPQIVKLVGLVEYLNDQELVELIEVLHGIMPTGGTILTHGLVDSWGNGRFMARVFGLRHQTRTEERLTHILSRAGFEICERFTEPVGIYPLLLAKKAA